MTTILLARHGEPDWNHENRFQGQTEQDPPLNETGRAQAAALAQALAGEPLAAVYTSPLRRARETADVLAAPRGLEPVELDALCEVDVGSWAGLTREEVAARYPDQYHRWLNYEQGWEDGETYEEMGERVVAGLLELASAHDGATILVVTHGGPIRATLAFADGITHAEARRAGPVVANTYLTRIAVQDGRFRRVD